MFHGCFGSKGYQKVSSRFQAIPRAFQRPQEVFRRISVGLMGSVDVRCVLEELQRVSGRSFR